MTKKNGKAKPAKAAAARSPRKPATARAKPAAATKDKPKSAPRISARVVSAPVDPVKLPTNLKPVLVALATKQVKVSHERAVDKAGVAHWNILATRKKGKATLSHSLRVNENLTKKEAQTVVDDVIEALGLEGK